MKVPLFTMFLFCAAVTTILVANFLIFAMVGEVNRQLSEAEQVKYFFWYPGKLDRVKRLYQKLYPGGRLLLLVRLCYVLTALFALAFAWQFGFFR